MDVDMSDFLEAAAEAAEVAPTAVASALRAVAAGAQPAAVLTVMEEQAGREPSTIVRLRPTRTPGGLVVWRTRRRPATY